MQLEGGSRLTADAWHLQLAGAVLKDNHWLRSQESLNVRKRVLKTVRSKIAKGLKIMDLQ